MKNNTMFGAYVVRCLSIAALFLGTAIAAVFAHGEPNELLAEAIKGASKLHGSLPTKERLATYETIFDSLDQITREHPSSDQAIQVLSGQQIGDFNPTNLRTAYIEELTTYYETVCEASPSYSCLGFVSLNIGNQQCELASTFEEIVDAHDSLRNAVNVFIGQQASHAYISLAMNGYRDCLRRSKFEATTFATDYFSSALLDSLLALDQVSSARAAIEQMDTPYFKFLGVLRLSDHEDRTFDQPFWDRMERYIDEEIPGQDGGDAMAGYALMLNAIRRSPLTIDYDAAVGSVVRGWSTYWESCDHLFSRTLFEVLSTLQAELLGLDPTRKGYYGGQETHLMIQAAEIPKRALSACKTEGLYDYYLMTFLHGQLLLDSPSVAAEFKRISLGESFSDREQLEFFFDHFGATSEKLALLVGPHDPQESLFTRLKVDEILALEDSRYFIFEKRVDFSDVCEGSRILFQDLKGGRNFGLAIEYMIDSPNIDPNETYDCGDEDLELLLQ